ncbi:MAG: AAA family ATPase [Pseudohongiella sp.]|uniref:CpaE family protein n=1 Tax=Pseudohongiella sp. TaxID=1979412 RepID=UPI0034A0A7FE
MQNQLSVVSLVLNQKTGDDLNNAMHGIDSLTHKVQRYQGQQPLADLARLAMLPDVVVLELDNENKDSLDDIAFFVEKHGEVTHVFVTVQDASVNLIRQLMRNGVRDVLAQPITAIDITTALESTRARRRKVIATSTAHRGRVCAFLNTRGGAGSSFLALNVAHQLTTEFNKTVCLVDMDIQFGTITVDLDVRADAGVLEALRNPSRIDQVFIDSLMVRHPSGLSFLPSPGDLSHTDDIKADAVTRLINTLADSYDLVVISMPTCLNECNEQVLRMSDPVFLVTQNTLSMLRNLKIMIERLPLRDIPKAHLAVIHNRTDTVVHDPIFRKMEKVMDGVPLYRVRSDFKLAAQAATEGKTANELSTRAGIIKDIRVISSMLAGKETPDATQKRRGLFGWFS